MEKMSHYFSLIIRMSPMAIYKAVIRRLKRKIRDVRQKRKDFDFPKELKVYPKLIFDRKGTTISGIDPDVLKWINGRYLEHRFDLLGSGWVKLSYGNEVLGVEGNRYQNDRKYDLAKLVLPTHYPQAKRIASGIDRDRYEPIDWQKDFKSGFAWSEQRWHKDQRVYPLGADIKVPWEISRMQHLPQLAVFAIQDSALREKNLNEFKNQVLDFIAVNPIRMGVNWVCTMDVAIRISNILLAFDLFQTVDKWNILDQKFEQEVTKSAYQHGKFIKHNLEYYSSTVANHYLSDIVGLLVVATYLETNRETTQWLAFAIQELVSQTKLQFYPDGANFESSTAYHRLSGELVAFGTAYVLGLSEEKIESLQNYSTKGWKVIPKLEPLEKQEYCIKNEQINFPNWYQERVYKMAIFSKDITRPDGDIVQFGDNDSGRFFRISPVGKFLKNEEVENYYLNLKGYW